MKTELKAKFLQNILRKKKENEGFTLIELLVVIIIIGILSAIALPSFLNQATKARQSEAKNYVGSMNRAQQAFYLENNNAFTTSVVTLALGIKTTTDNFKYTIDAVATTGSVVTNKGSALKKALKSYAGVTYTASQTVDGVTDAITLAVMCESAKPATTDIATGIAISNGTTNGACPNDVNGEMRTIK
ncbi:type IV pilin-like G/H family protein [Calothrix sp. CCY 0018]|uniref:type IV pilin-like G/H family protein n=1 Tax=Calothrix sp. CCY 0018 TaxID=3103864 RepID=UPI0039C618D6